jgi:hypothetical protein
MVADRKCPITVPAGTELLLSSHVEGIKNWSYLHIRLDCKLFNNNFIYIPGRDWGRDHPSIICQNKTKQNKKLKWISDSLLYASFLQILPINNFKWLKNKKLSLFLVHPAASVSPVWLNSTKSKVTDTQLHNQHLFEA